MNHFNLPNVNSIDLIQLENILQNNQFREFAGEAWLILASGKSPSNLLAYVKICIARVENEHRQKRAVFISLDERQSDDDFSNFEKLAAEDPCELASSRKTVLHNAAEVALDLVNNGAEAIGRCTLVTGGKMLCRRRGEQIRKFNVDKQEQAEIFKRGGQGQGGLFGFDGEVDNA
jgi:hypothetical protein